MSESFEEALISKDISDDSPVPVYAPIADELESREPAALLFSMTVSRACAGS